MACAASWIPTAIAETLLTERSAKPIIAWLTTIRNSIEEYDPLIAVRPPTPESDEESTSDSAFDEILSQLGTEIYKLDEYQNNLAPAAPKEVSLSILNIFNECLEGMTEIRANEQEIVEEMVEDQKCEVTIVEVLDNNVVNGDEATDCESTLSDVSFVTSTPKCEVINCDETKTKVIPPIPPPRTRLKVSDYVEMDRAKLDSDSDSESTCWSYQECSNDVENERVYAAVWSHSSGFHNSDQILKKILSQHYATISPVSFDTVSDFTPTQYSVYALQEVGVEKCDNTNQPVPQPVVNMTADKPDDDYEPVRDAITTDENIYEEIEYGYSYTDEGCSCGDSIEVESYSMTASSEGVGRESPLYVNLRDHDAYAVTPDVLYWKNLLLDPFYNEDEEDEWITPEECAVYSREQRPPFVIPRITQYRPPRRETRGQYVAHSYPEEKLVNSSLKGHKYEQLDISPSSEKSRGELERHFSKANSDSPPFTRINKRWAGSSENLLNIRRQNHLNLPASSSGDSLDVDIREKDVNSGRRNRKSRSMVAPKNRARSPVPAPRYMLQPLTEAQVVLEGPVKRTRYAVGGKKGKKHWQDCYLVLTHTALLFYKDHKTYMATRENARVGSPPSPGGAGTARAELVLPLQNAYLVPCIKVHTSRYTRSLSLTVGYDQYLLQDETEEGAKRWLRSIYNVIYKLGPPILGDMQPSLIEKHYQSSNTDLESLGRTPPAVRHANKQKPKVGGSSNEDLSDSTEVSIQKSHVRSRLRKFFAKRPAMDVLVKKGIYKDEPVFGRNLEEVCPSTSPRVPEFVIACVRQIESSEENMCTDGLYRASGNLSQVQKIRLEIDQNNQRVIENNTDIHVLTGSLKLFFRELKEPLIPCTMFDRVLSACSIRPREAKIKEFRDIVNSLPQCNRDTLKFLLEHLLRVTKYSEHNRMHTANLAIVFGPTLLWAPAEQAHNIAIDCIQQNNVVDMLLTEFNEIFVEKGKKKA